MGLYFGWVRVGGHLLWVDGGGWWYVEVYFACVGMGGHFLWVGADGWVVF